MNIPDKKLRLLKILESGNVELRCFENNSDLAKKKQQTICWLGVYDDYTALANSINLAEKSGADVYHTINPVGIPASNNSLKPFQRGARDADVLRIKTLFFDFDPVRESGTAATIEQKILARNQAIKLHDYLVDDHGWAECTVGDSGNGYHLYFNVDLPVSYKSKYLDGLYLALEKRFSTDDVSFDVTVRNPARIARCLGTTNRKANRKSHCYYSDGFTDKQKIIDLSELIVPPKVKPSHFVRTENQVNIKPNHNIITEIASSGLNVKETPEHGKYWMDCINKSQHSKTGEKDTVIWVNEQGFYTYHCSHDHCSHLTSKDLAVYLGVAA